jgi:hypothetical protein
MTDLPKKYGIDDLVAIHQTAFDTGKVLRPEGFYKPESARSTIHFSLNGLVKTHSGGSYDDRKFAVVIPLKEIRDRVVALSSEDTYIIGNLDLERAEVLHPSEVRDFFVGCGYDWHELNAQGWHGWSGPQQELLAESLGFDSSPHKLHWTYKLEDLFYRHLTSPSDALAERIREIIDVHGKELPDYILSKVVAVLSQQENELYPLHAQSS